MGQDTPEKQIDQLTQTMFSETTNGKNEEHVLVLNAGSSSLKFALFAARSSLDLISSGMVERIGLPKAVLSIQACAGQPAESAEVSAPDHLKSLDLVLERLASAVGNKSFRAVGHRVVHGGPRYGDPQKIDRAMLAELRRVSPFDPDHLPAEIALMERVAAKFPEVPQIACFDTAFHRAMPRVATLLPIPRRYETLGVHRYGFHGLSYAYLMEELERLAGTAAANARVVFAHLGNGASMVAVRNGRSVDTTMAFTPAAGLMMSTRSGDLDPGLVSFLARSEHMTAQQFDRMVNHESGLRGVSETSSDLRDLLAQEGSDVRSAEAVALFCYQIKKTIGAYAAVLGGIDTLVFAGGIGENATAVRARVCDGLGFLGLELSESRNAAHAPVISTESSRATIRVMHTNEELLIARSLFRVLNPGARLQKEA